MREHIDEGWNWCRRRPEAALATVLTAATIAIVAAAGLLSSLGSVPAAALTLGFVVLVGWARRWPIQVAVVAGIQTAIPDYGRSMTVVENSNLIAVMWAAAIFVYTYALGSRREWRRSLLGLIPLIAGLMIGNGGWNPLLLVLPVGPWLIGLAVASRRRLARLLEVRARELDEEREVFAAQSVRYERARIARELHDIVAHCVSLMVVQASAGEHLTGPDPQGAAEAFESITVAARQANVEIDRLVELLDADAPAQPSAGLRIVEELVRRVQASGLRVSCQFSGDLDDVSEPVAETAYRLVQEAITNAMKHAAAAPIAVAVGGSTGRIEVDVVNRPAPGGSSGLENAGGGRGLAGMRERVARCGGTFDAGPTAEGGWRVTAGLPRHRPGAAVPAVTQGALGWA